METYKLYCFRKEDVMANDISIALYTPDHRDTCAEMFERVYSSPPFGFDWLNADKTFRYFSDLENQPNSLNYVLMEYNSVIGVCMGQKEESFQTPGYKINEFFIEPGRQRMGLGSFFVSELEKKLREMDLKVMYLFTQRNMGSYFFYRKNGFFSNDKTVHMARAIQQEPTIVYTRTFLNSDSE